LAGSAGHTPDAPWAGGVEGIGSGGGSSRTGTSSMRGAVTCVSGGDAAWAGAATAATSTTASGQPMLNFLVVDTVRPYCRRGGPSSIEGAVLPRPKGGGRPRRTIEGGHYTVYAGPGADQAQPPTSSAVAGGEIGSGVVHLTIVALDLQCGGDARVIG
jgi:hypothetical protein